MKAGKIALNDKLVIERIYIVRGQKIMPDKDLAALYKVTTSNLNKAVSRNRRRFPEDFMFQLTKEEFANLIFQTGTSSWGGTRKRPYAFTERGVAMLSGILKSNTAIDVNIQIMRVFTRRREVLISHNDILLKLEKLEKKYFTTTNTLKNMKMKFWLCLKLLNN